MWLILLIETNQLFERKLFQFWLVRYRLANYSISWSLISIAFGEITCCIICFERLRLVLEKLIKCCSDKILVTETRISLKINPIHVTSGTIVASRCLRDESLQLVTVQYTWNDLWKEQTLTWVLKKKVVDALKWSSLIKMYLTYLPVFYGFTHKFNPFILTAFHLQNMSQSMCRPCVFWN